MKKALALAFPDTFQKEKKKEKSPFLIYSIPNNKQQGRAYKI